MMRGQAIWIAAFLAGALTACRDARVDVLIPDGSSSFPVMDFSQPFPLDPPPAGWYHRRFWRHRPMEISFASKEGVPAIRLATHDTASMLFRRVEIALDVYPTLAWQWYIEQGIDSALDELTREGDDHPARFYIVFEAPAGGSHRMEIIWGNRVLGAGDYKEIDGFPHYVANGGASNIGRWHRETVDLGGVYETLWGDPTGVRMVDIGIFCDSDETGGETIAYVADVRVEQPRAPQ